METEKKARGRPAGNKYPHVKPVRLGEEDAADLAALVAEWRCSDAAAIRRAIHEARKRLKRTKDGGAGD
jgi:hypothetical protein